MRYTRFISKEDADSLQFEVVSQDLKVFLTRKLDRMITPDDDVPPIAKTIWQNESVNRSRSLVGLPVYVLTADDDGFFQPAEIAWHNGEFQLVFRRLSTVQFIEFTAELIEEDHFDIEEVNSLLEQDGLSFRYLMTTNGLRVDVLPIEVVADKEHETQHPNIRVLVSRMDDALGRKDYAGVLHASASVFETMAKDIVGRSTVQDQSLASFFGRYRKDSSLPDELLDYILDTYNSRSTTPLAGHGSTQAPTIARETAVTLAEMTKAFVHIEYKLQSEPSVGR